MMNITKTSNEVIEQLQQQILDDYLFVTTLTASLELANNLAQKNLDSNLYQVLNQLFNGKGWPMNPVEYIMYLTNFANIVPSENIDVSYDPWQNTSGQNGYSQEIYDRLCQFYWLVDTGSENITLQSYTSPINNFSFATWLDDYAKAWGSNLDNAASLTEATLNSFTNDPEYNLADYTNDKPNWNCFNKFFFRELNATQVDGSPMRPVAAPNDNTIICSPADCTYKAYYQIDSSGNIIDNNGNATKIVLKHTHPIGNVTELLNNSEYAQNFYNGTFVHYFLSPFDYHRFHTPVSGVVKTLEAVNGNVYLNVNISNKQFDAPDGAADGYEFTQARGVLIIDTGNVDIGYVATAPIGMAQVSSVNMNTELVNQSVVKGQEFGYFAFGGSDIIMLFQQPLSQLKLITQVANGLVPDSYSNAAPFHFKYGEASVIILP